MIPLAYLGFSRATFGGAHPSCSSSTRSSSTRTSGCGSARSRKVISSPQFHHWHHTNDPHARDRNFAGLFPWIDALFGTLHLPDREWPATYGVDDPIPSGYLRQLASPFRPRPGAPGCPAAVPSATCVEPSIDDLDVIELEVIDLSEPARAGSGAVTDWRSFEDRYATLAFGLGTVPRRQHADDPIWQRPAGLLLGVARRLVFLALLSTAH